MSSNRNHLSTRTQIGHRRQSDQAPTITNRTLIGEDLSLESVTINTAAEVLGIPRGTLATWLTQLAIPHNTDSRGRRRLTADAMALLETVKSLRDSDCGYQTIRRKIGTLPDTDSPSNQYQHETGSASAGAQSVTVEALTERITAAITANNELAERYARVTYQMGCLETERNHLRQQLATLEARLTQVEQTQTLWQALKSLIMGRR